jgi:hypothetical protein
MLYQDKIQAHTRQAGLNAQKAEEYLQRGQQEKSDHYRRIAEAHRRNALFYRKHSQIISLALSF